MSLVRLYETTDQMTLNLIKLRFDEEGVVYRVFFEEMLRTGSAEVLGNRGAIIEVGESYYGIAKDLLRELDIDLDYDTEEDEFAFLKPFDEFTQRIPILNKLALPFRLVAVAFTIVALFFLIVLFQVSKIDVHKLTSGYWCVEKVIHQKQELAVETTGFSINIPGIADCENRISFAKGSVNLPGINSASINAKYKVQSDNSFIISEAGNFSEIYEGIYEIETSVFSNHIQLVSSNTTFFLKKQY